MTALHGRRGPALPATPRRASVLLAVACTAQFMLILDVAVMNVALPQIRVALGFSPQGLQWVLSAYTLAFGSLLLLGGRTGDLIGQRRVLLTGLGLFTAASLAAGLANSGGVLVAARAVQGLGAALLAPATLAILSLTFADGPERSRALGLWGAMAGVGGSAGSVLGGVLTATAGWRWTMFVNVPVGLALVAVAAWAVPRWRPPSDRRGADVCGALLLTLGLLALVFGIVRIEADGVRGADVLASVGAGVALLVVFVWFERRGARHPLVPMRIFASRTLVSANVVMLLLGAASFAMWFLLSLYLQEILGYGALTAGLAFLPLSASTVVGAQVASRLCVRFGVRPVLATGMVALAGGMALLGRMPVDGGYVVDVLGPGLLTTVGMGLSYVPATIAAVSGVMSADAGLASGLLTTARQVGGALGLVLLATVAATHADALRGAGTAAEAALAGGYGRAFLVGAGFALAGALAATLVQRTGE